MQIPMMANMTETAQNILSPIIIQDVVKKLFNIFTFTENFSKNIRLPIAKICLIRPKMLSVRMIVNINITGNIRRKLFYKFFLQVIVIGM